MSDKVPADEPKVGAKRSMLDSIRQWLFPPEFRISPPCPSPNSSQSTVEEAATIPDANAELPNTSQSSAEGTTVPDANEEPQTIPSTDGPPANQLIAEIASCLWYLKTKHFKKAWGNDATDDGDTDEDPRVRRAIGRLNRGIDALKDNGIEIDDPTNKRYPPGGEGMMRPLQFQPTAGLTCEMVTETVTPIVYRNGQLVQRGEVFVAVPQEIPQKEPQSATEGDDENGKATKNTAQQGQPAVADQDESSVPPNSAPESAEVSCESTTNNAESHAGPKDDLPTDGEPCDHEPKVASEGDQ